MLLLRSCDDYLMMHPLPPTSLFGPNHTFFETFTQSPSFHSLLEIVERSHIYLLVVVLSVQPAPQTTLSFHGIREGSLAQ